MASSRSRSAKRAVPRRAANASDTVVVIGLGRFGRSLALELMADGAQVLGIDADPAIVQRLSGDLTHVVRADATDEQVLRQLGVHEFDRAVVAIGTHVEASILTASLLKKFEIANVWAKAISSAHGRILEQLAVHHVVYPEHDMGRRVAHLVRGRMQDFVEVDEGFALVKTLAPSCLHGLTLAQAQVRSRHGVTIVALKRAGQGFTHTTAETVVEPGDLLIVTGQTSAVETFSELL